MSRRGITRIFSCFMSELPQNYFSTFQHCTCPARPFPEKAASHSPASIEISSLSFDVGTHLLNAFFQVHFRFIAESGLGPIAIERITRPRRRCLPGDEGPFPAPEDFH